MKLRVFLADDDKLLADLLSASLNQRDAKIQSVDRGSMALMELKDFQPHLAFFYANLKGVSGYDLCEIVKQDAELNHAKVVLIDSEEQPLDLERAESVGYDATIRKPFSVDNITVLLESLGVGGFDEEGELTQPGEEGFFDMSGDDSLDMKDSGAIFATKEEDDEDRDELLAGEESSADMGESLEESESADAEVTESQEGAPAKPPTVKSQVSIEQVLSTEAGQKILKEIVAQISDTVVREVAWQVVPEMAEEIIKETIEKLRKKQES